MRVFSMELEVNLIKTLVGHITVEDEVSFTSKYYLIATINHSGSLNRGHYWTFIKDIHSSSWYSCNDKLVFNFEESSPNNTTQYILFLQHVPQDPPKIFMVLQGVFVISDIAFRCGDPQYTPVLCGNWVFLLIFQALQPCSS